MKDYLRDLSQVSIKDIKYAGGKGASLGEMLNAKIPVPPGFVVSTEAFSDFLQENQIDKKISELFKAIDFSKPTEVTAVSRRIQSMIMKGEISTSLVKSIETSAKTLGAKYLAVRSSATGEDSKTSAWAGQLDSFLNVIQSNLMENIQKCWASLYTPRAMVYRAEKSLLNDEALVAVVVQKMVESEVAGVAFSIDPVAQDTNLVVIEAGLGLCEALVSGKITPDRYVFEKKAEKITEKIISTQKIKYSLNTQGKNEWTKILKNIGSSQKLPDSEIKKLVKIIIDIEKHYKSPVDVEWALENSRIFITQSRPITTITDTEIEPESITPGLNIGKLSKIKWRFIHKRYRTPFFAYMLWDGISRHHDDEILFPYQMSNWLALDSNLMVDENEWERVKTLAIDELLKNNNFLFDITKHFYNLNQKIEKLTGGFRGMDYSLLDNTQLSDKLKKYVDLSLMAAASMLFPMFIEEPFVDKLKKTINQKFDRGRDKIFQILTTPIRPSVVQEEEKRLLELAIKKSKGQDISLDIIQHCQLYAWLKNTSYDGSFFTLSDFKKRIDLLVQDNPEKKLREYENKIHDANKIFEHYREKLKSNKPIISIIDTLQEAIYFRSWRTERFYLNGYNMQSFFQEVGKRMNISDSKDIFFLTPIEIIEYLEKGHKILQKSINARKEGFILFSNGKDTKIYSGTCVTEALESIRFNEEDDHDQIRGQVAYRGTAQGPARIVKSKKDLKSIQTGDILVTNSTTVDFLPYLKKVRGIITDEGGVLSHASVISRELHIPCIIGTGNASKILTNQQIVLIKAKINGIVKIIKV